MKKTLEEELADQLAREMSKDIDSEIFTNLMKDIGWTEVKLPLTKDTIEILNWLEKNTTGKYYTLNNTFLFESKKDAEWFLLKWQ